MRGADVGPGDAWPCGSPAAAADFGPGSHAAAQDDDEHDGADQDGAPVARHGPSPTGRIRHCHRRGRRHRIRRRTAAAAENRPPPKPPVHVPPPVEVMRTVVAVTAPLRGRRTERAHAVTDGQGGRGRRLGRAQRRRARGRDLEALGLGRRRLLASSSSDLVFGRGKLPGVTSTPDTVTVEPLTPVTLPDAMAIEATLAELPRPSRPGEARAACRRCRRRRSCPPPEPEATGPPKPLAGRRRRPPRLRARCTTPSTWQWRR